MKVVIAAGGTAGHVNPGVALAEALTLTDTDITFVGTSRGPEAKLVVAAGYAFEAIEVAGLDRSRPTQAPAIMARAARAVKTARRLLTAIGPDVVVGMGGYVGLPVCVAARTLRIPVVIHEQNIVLGLANKLCKRFARRVAVSWEDSLASAGRRGVVVGNPVPSEVRDFDRDVERDRGLKRFELDPERKTLLVFGGSQGAGRLNQAARGVRRLWSDRSDRQVLHITGPGRLTEGNEPGAEGGGPTAPGGAEVLDAAPRDSALLYRGVEFVERMVEAYAVADLGLCRGGATTVAELTAVGLPSMIVPYPFHRDRQQERHGKVLERAGAAVLVPDAAAIAEHVAATADTLLSDENRLAHMTGAARSLGRPDAASRLAAVVREAAA